MNPKKRYFVLMFLLLLGILSSYRYFQAQEIDPFYFRLLEKGKKSFQEGNYREAVKELEIAAFGLYGDKKLLAHIYVYMGISFYHLKNIEKSKEYLRDAVELIGGEELMKLELENSARIELENLMNSFKLGGPQPQQMEKVPVESEKSGESGLNTIRNLENAIKANPRNTSLYYELYNLYRKNNNLTYARRTLKNLIKNNPNDIKGYYHLARMEYEEKHYKEAEKNFEKILELSKKIQMDQKTLFETRAYLILSSYLGGNRKKTRERIFAWIDDFAKEDISSLTLNIESKETLQKIIRFYRPQVDREREKTMIAKLKSDLKQNPQDVSLYYELYEIYKRRRDSKEAEDVLKDLVKNNPEEVRGFFLLGKIYYKTKRYKRAVGRFVRTSIVSNETYVDRELIVKSTIYICLCFHHLNQKKEAKSRLEELYHSSSEEELQRLVMEEGLQSDWENMKRELQETNTASKPARVRPS